LSKDRDDGDRRHCKNKHKDRDGFCWMKHSLS
jgi:hypothetical protein